MKFNHLILSIAVALAAVACDSQTSPKQESQPLTDYSAVAPAPAPIENGEYVCQRPAEGERLFTSQAVEAEIERITNLKYQVKDLRLFSENDIRFLKLFESAN